MAPSSNIWGLSGSSLASLLEVLTMVARGCDTSAIRGQETKLSLTRKLWCPRAQCRPPGVTLADYLDQDGFNYLAITSTLSSPTYQTTPARAPRIITDMSAASGTGEIKTQTAASECFAWWGGFSGWMGASAMTVHFVMFSQCGPFSVLRSVNNTMKCIEWFWQHVCIEYCASRPCNTPVC